LAADPAGGDGVTQELSASERTRLEDALYAVLTLIAGADGVVDAAETQRFTHILESVAGGDDALMAEVARAVIAGVAARARQPLDANAANDRVRAAVAFADARMPPEVSHRFKHGLYLLGTQLAQASGGGMLGLRNRTSDDERRALKALAELLDIGG
jgi:hypothetical protein